MFGTKKDDNRKRSQLETLALRNGLDRFPKGISCYDGVSRVLSERGRRRRCTVSPVEIVSQRAPRARSQVWPGRRYH